MTPTAAAPEPTTPLDPETPMPRTRTARTRRRLAAAALAVVGVAGLGAAAAAQLSVGTTALAAGSAVVTSCQPVGQAIQVGFTSVFSGGAYQAQNVVLRNIAPACAGQKLVLTVQNTSGGSLQQVTVNSVTAGTMTVDITDRAASTIGGVAVVITG